MRTPPEQVFVRHLAHRLGGRRTRASEPCGNDAVGSEPNDGAGAAALRERGKGDGGSARDKCAARVS
jgi:hypothetical protein